MPDTCLLDKYSTFFFYVIGNCDAQTAEMELIAAQYRGRARVLQAKTLCSVIIIIFD